MNGTPLIQFADVSKVYHLESGDLTALNHITLDINDGEFVALMGPSGSGKSTMMNQLVSSIFPRLEKSSSPVKMWPT